MISKRLSNLSSNIELFNASKHEYDAALRKSGYSEPVTYQSSSEQTKKRRKRKIIWFNPPYSSNVATDIGRQFFNLIDKHFPKNSSLHKIINKNTIKLCYCCMPSFEKIYKCHHKNVLDQSKNNEETVTCNCRDKSKCPLQEKCLTPSMIYKADVKTSHGKIYHYIGLTEPAFKS